jgi:hypothetical protein
MTKEPILRYSADALLGIDKLVSQRPSNICPVMGCSEKTESGGKFPICRRHGLEIHKSTFVYYNGNSREDKKRARLRNLLLFGGEDFVTKQILDTGHKAESHRLGYENSEDALTWNIFGGLLHYKRLHRIYNQLTGTNSSPNELQLFLWGLKIDFNAQQTETWGPLLKVRKSLESDIKHFFTEPDIMILGPTHLVCIEAKFTSGNPIARSIDVGAGEKPKSRDGLINRYVRSIQIDDKLFHPVIQPEHLGEKVHSQLLRMIIFTSTMAQLEGRRDWIVANLASKTQWDKKINKSRGYDFDDPTPSIPASVRNNFKFISWEYDIYENVLKHDPVLVELSRYMENKTANLDKAFKLSDQ